MTNQTKNKDAVFGKEIKKRLIDLNMSQVELAEKIEVTPIYINYIIKGQRKGIRYITKIREVLKMDEELAAAE